MAHRALLAAPHFQFQYLQTAALGMGMQGLLQSGRWMVVAPLRMAAPPPQLAAGLLSLMEAQLVVPLGQESWQKGFGF